MPSDCLELKGYKRSALYVSSIIYLGLEESGASALDNHEVGGVQHRALESRDPHDVAAFLWKLPVATPK